MFKAKDYIRNEKALEDWECTVCYEVSPDLARCKGPCHKYFCLKCVSRSKYQYRPCPNRCTSHFQIEPIPGLKFTYLCPFSQQGCKHISNSQEEFQLHYQQCNFIGQQCKQQMQRKNNYECPKGHKLSFLTNQLNYAQTVSNGFYQSIMNQKCSICHEVTLCRSICLQCTTPNKKESFCIKCREVPCSKKSCPIGHALTIRTDFSYTLTCDFCGLSALIFDKIAYEDMECNFQICLRCHNKLQETHPLIPVHESQWNSKNVL